MGRVAPIVTPAQLERGRLTQGAVVDLGSWSNEELAGALLVSKVGDLPQPEPNKASTLYIVAQLTRQIQGYDRELGRIWDRTMAQLADAASDERHNQVTGHSEGDEAGHKVLQAGAIAFAGAAATRFTAAWGTGRDLALEFMSKDRLTISEQADLINAQVTRNTGFVRSSLFYDAEQMYREALRDRELSPDQTAAKVQDTGESMSSRVSMYAVKLWGIAHLAFGKELVADGRPMRWVLTSLKPCIDCPRLARSGPYSALHPLPTVPGLGDTECRTNCQCMLRED